MSLPIDPPPQYEKLIDKSEQLDPQWYRWGTQQVLARLLRCVQTLATVSAASQNASIAATTLYQPGQSGTFRICAYVRITVAAGVSSSLTVNVSWTDGGVACTTSFTAITGNTTATTGSGSAVIQADGGTAIQVSTTYASNPAAAMRYKLAAYAEQVN